MEMGFTCLFNLLYDVLANLRFSLHFVLSNLLNFVNILSFSLRSKRILCFFLYFCQYEDRI